MAATAEQIAQLRRMTAEPDVTTYSDAAVAAYIENHPVRDTYHREVTDSAWLPTYDLAGAASDIWSEKAAALAADYRVSTDGATLERNQPYEHAVERAQFWQSRSAIVDLEMVSEPHALKWSLWPFNNEGIVNALPDDPADGDP